jgi:hypothetical protein
MKNLIANYETKIKNSMDIIHEYFTSLKNKINLARDELVNEIQIKIEN